MSNLNTIENIIKEYESINIDNVVEKSNVYFIKKIINEDKKTWISMQMEPNGTLNRLYNTFKYVLNNKIKYRSNGKYHQKVVVPYSPTSSGDNEKIYFVDKLYLGNQFDEFKSKILSKELDSLELSEVYFYTYKITPNQEPIYIVGRIDKINRVRDGFVAKLKGKQIEFTKNDKFGIGEKFDFIVYKDTIYIFNKNGFENFFDLDEKFKNETRKHVKDIMKSNYFEGLDKYLEKVENDKRYTKKISKALDDFKEKGINYSDIEEKEFKKRLDFIVENDESIYINNENKVEYRDYNDLESVTKLIIDDYFIAILSQTFGSSD